MTTLDCRNFKCPQPVIETRKQLLAEPNSPLTVLVADTMARDNVERLARKEGYDVTVQPEQDGFVLDLTPATKKEVAAPGPVVQGKTVVYVGSDAMGNGSDELGRVLMRNFLFTLNELATPPDTLLFVNAGVKLVVTDSEVLEALTKLVDKGTDIASCGLCLDFFELKDQVQIGRVTNMLEVAETLQQAGRVMRP